MDQGTARTEIAALAAALLATGALVVVLLPPPPDGGPAPAQVVAGPARFEPPRVLAQAENRVQFERNKATCLNHTRDLVGLLEVTGKKYPSHAGPNLILYLVKKNEIGEKHLPLLFCPGDRKESLKKAGGAKAYRKLDLSRRGAYGSLTSYAGRSGRTGAPRYHASPWNASLSCARCAPRSESTWAA